MEMTGEQRIDAPRAKVWAALNDPEVLKACIPGCQSLEKIDDQHMKTAAAVKVGPITARFTGEVTLSELDPPNSYRIEGEGSGGAGFAKGGAAVRLRDDGDATLLSYEVTAQVGGKISQLGGGLIDATAKQMAGAFFKKFAQAVLVEALASAASPAAAAPRPEAAASVASASAMASVPRPVQAPAAPSTMALGLTALGAGLVGFLLGSGLTGWDDAGAWAGLAIGLLVVVVAGAAFNVGRRGANAPVVVVDAALLARLTAASGDGAK
jgi:uncharacterized protein